jgi:hypothetical protein
VLLRRLQMTQMYESDKTRSEDRHNLINRTKNILRWRMNPRSAEIAVRFESVKHALRRNLDGQAEGSLPLQQSVDVIKNSFDEAFGIWSIGVPANA